jgi:hypothetical protein
LTALAIARQLKSVTFPLSVEGGVFDELYGIGFVLLENRNELMTKYLVNPQASRAQKRSTNKGKTLRPGGNTSTGDDGMLTSGMMTPMTPELGTPVITTTNPPTNITNGLNPRRLTVDINDNKEEKIPSDASSSPLISPPTVIHPTSLPHGDTRDIKRHSITAISSANNNHYATPQGLSVIPGLSSSLQPPGLKPIGAGGPSMQPPLSPSNQPKKPSISQQHKLHKLLGEDPELFRQTPFHLPPPPSSSHGNNNNNNSNNHNNNNNNNNNNNHLNNNALSPNPGSNGHHRVPSHQYSTTVYPSNSLFATLNQTPSSIAASTSSALSHSISAPAVGKRGMPPLPSPHGNGTTSLNDRPTTSSGRDAASDGWDMHRILHDAGCRGALLKHMEKQLCDESLLFWIAVQV